MRYRAQYALEALRDLYGVSFTLVLPGYSTQAVIRFVAAYLLLLLLRKRSSVIVFQKLHTNRWYVRALKVLLRLRSKATIYDTDDADYLRFPVDTIHHFATHCTACTVGSKALQEYFREFNPHTALLTSPVIQHSVRKDGRSAVFTLGWIGYWCDHRDSLMELAFPALRTLSFPLKLILIGMTDAEAAKEVETYFTGCTHITLECPLDIDWLGEERIYQRIVSFDAGLAPLLDTEMNRAKSAFKAKLYLSCGVPVLGSAVGENKTFIHHGINGFICNSPAQYKKRLTSLAAMPAEKYATLSRGAYASANGFSMSLYCHRFLQIAHSAL